MIGGNTELILQVIDEDNEEFDKNGKRIPSYKTVATLLGWLDLITGDSDYNYKAKIEDSTHVFVCDYNVLGKIDFEKARALTLNITEYEELKTTIYEFVKNMDYKDLTEKTKEFDIRYIDNPMELNQQLEIYLKTRGGQNG